jgi:uncharacterized protein
VILIDANLLIYAVNQDGRHHKEARQWLETVLSGREGVGLPWIVLLAFLRITTQAGILPRPLPIDAALDLIRDWLDSPNCSILEPGPDHARILRKLLLGAGAGGNLTNDAHLAAIAIERGAELCTLDRDFGRFPGLRWRNPLPPQE